MAQKLKRPDGWVVEEYVTASAHFFEDGKFIYHDNETERGRYTGRLWFEFKNGKSTRIYTDKTAPKWLLALRREAVT